ncbi:MAG: GAF domain-containing protein, partial [Acidobacteriota bacterium]|nr:GAF domain-containing protein [Acidobacteriota bacterium]
MENQVDNFRRCLDRLRSAIPYLYGQWVVEDPRSHDYRVAAAVLPEGEAGYEVAHRTGVIGQVFRTRQAIAVQDTRNHPLYDPFDTTIDWELCFPVFDGEEMKAVLNFEGAGAFAAADWEHVCQAVRETTSYLPPPSAPTPGGPCLVQTRRIEIRAGDGGAHDSDIVGLAQAAACGGESVLLVGDYPELLRGRRPTTTEASKQGLGVSYCYFGV